MNFFSPELLLLSGRIALLVLVASFVAFVIGRMTVRRPALVGMVSPELKEESFGLPGAEELIQARVLSAELARNLAATESQCVGALEQRDEAERQAVQRSTEVRKLQEELEAVKSQREEMVQLLESQQRQREKANLTAAALEQQSLNFRLTLETREREIVELKKEMEALRNEMRSLQRDHDLSRLRENELTEQVKTQENVARLTLESAETSAREKHAIERSLQTVPPPSNGLIAGMPTSSAQLPRPPLPPPQVLHPISSEETFDIFPPAPPATTRKAPGESLFDEASMASFAPVVPNLDDAQNTLAHLRQELQEKDQRVEALSIELAVQKETLEAPLPSPKEKQQGKRQAVQKSGQATAAQLTTARREQDRCRRQVRALTRSLGLAAEHADQADDLTRIKGIKSGISQQLHAFGIFTYRQIVHWDEEDMLAFGELLAFKNRLHRDKWQDQARALMKPSYGTQQT